MTPAARLQAAIGILEAFQHTDQPLDRLLKTWFAKRRSSKAACRAWAVKRPVCCPHASLVAEGYVDVYVGDCARLTIRGVDVIVSSVRHQVLGLDAFTALGVDPTALAQRIAALAAQKEKT